MHRRPPTAAHRPAYPTADALARTLVIGAALSCAAGLSAADVAPLTPPPGLMVAPPQPPPPLPVVVDAVIDGWNATTRELTIVAGTATMVHTIPAGVMITTDGTPADERAFTIGRAIRLIITSDVVTDVRVAPVPVEPAAPMMGKPMAPANR